MSTEEIKTQMIQNLNLLENDSRKYNDYSATPTHVFDRDLHSSWNRNFDWINKFPKQDIYFDILV